MVFGGVAAAAAGKALASATRGARRRRRRYRSTADRMRKDQKRSIAEYLRKRRSGPKRGRPTRRVTDPTSRAAIRRSEQRRGIRRTRWGRPSRGFGPSRPSRRPSRGPRRWGRSMGPRRGPSRGRPSRRITVRGPRSIRRGYGPSRGPRRKSSRTSRIAISRSRNRLGPASSRRSRQVVRGRRRR